MIGVLLVNMGGPESPEELRQFYRLMFLDKHIIPVPFLIRKFLSLYISATRFKTGWTRYEMIGGTPLKKNTKKLVAELQSTLGNGFSVKEAYSYSEPFISKALTEFISNKITEIVVVPLYPQASISTTTSVIADVNKFCKNHSGMNIKIIPEFYCEKNFVEYWNANIQDHIKENKLNNPLLLFSAHSIPLALINKGDTYQKGIEESARLIARKANLNYRVSYQSGMNSKTWLGPDTKILIETLAKEGFNEIVIIPISFISENLETLYDLDKDIIPDFRSKLQIQLSRVEIPVLQHNFLDMLKDFAFKN